MPAPRSTAAEDLTRLAPPPLLANVVARPRIERALDQAMLSRVTLVSAGPGSGKTWSVASWATSGNATRGRIAWLSLDETDNEPVQLWHDLLAALAVSGHLVPRAGPHTSLFDMSEIRRRTAGLSRRDEPIVLVLDNVHELTEHAVLAGLERLIDALPSQLRLVLLTRVDPPLRLHRLRVAGELSEIRGTDLAFDTEEVERLLAGEGLRVGAAHRDLLMARTEGWITGLKLAVLSLGDAVHKDMDVEQAIEDFSGDQRTVVDYLLGEVLDRQPPELKELLLRTSIVERVCGSLADELTGGSDAHHDLEQLSQANPLVLEADVRHGWFRYHPLVREFLLHQQRADEPALVPDLHRRAARWFAAHGLLVEAIGQASSAEDWRFVRRTLVDAALPRMFSRDRAALTTALRPAAVQARLHPSLDTLLPAAVCHRAERNISGMARDADEAARRLVEAEPAERAIATVAIRVVQIMSSWMSGSVRQTVRRAEETIGVLVAPSAPHPPAARHYDVIATGFLGAGELWQGRLAQARRHLDDVVTQSEELGLELVLLQALTHRAVIDAVQGRLRAARTAALDALEQARRWGWAGEPEVRAAHLALALVDLQRDTCDRAAAYLKAGLDAGADQPDGALRLALGIAMAHVQVASLQLTTARMTCDRLRRDAAETELPEWLSGWLARAEIETLLLARNAEDVVAALAAAPDRLDPDDRLLLIRAHLILGGRRRAAQLLSDLLEHPPSNLSAHVAAWLVAAQLADARHDDALAIEALRRAFALAQPEQLVRPFHVLGSAIERLVARHRDAVDGLVTFVTTQTGSASTAVARGDPPYFVERLSPREHAVLSYLPSMLTNEEIGQALFVSVNTVKAHLKSLYRKLGVHGRRAAVRRARDLGLL